MTFNPPIKKMIKYFHFDLLRDLFSFIGIKEIKL